MNRKNRLGKCHFCVCTVCTRSRCPWKHKILKECYLCKGHEIYKPRLDCDYFQHYLKVKRFKFRRAKLPLPSHFGTYILDSQYMVHVGSYDKLYPLYKKLGGTLKPLNILSIGDDFNE